MIGAAPRASREHMPNARRRKAKEQQAVRRPNATLLALSMLPNLLEVPKPPIPPNALVRNGCPPQRVLPPIRRRTDLGKMLRTIGLRGAAAELGVKEGFFTAKLLNGWRQSSHYVQVDVWAPLENYVDRANFRNGSELGERRRNNAARLLEQEVRLDHAAVGSQCVNLTTHCARRFPDGYFDFLYVDARHDYLGVLQDLHDWWPKLREGGIMAGHDYTTQKEPPLPMYFKDPSRSSQDWTINFDGTRDTTGRVVKGAVDDFFGGVSTGRFPSPPELRRCPRQISVCYRETGWNTWMVSK
jgi:hypothetical protein